MLPPSVLNDALQGRYIVERELGRGGMATVYLARDLRHDRSVALKLLHPELAASLGAERFLREIRTTARLQHPHILTLLDSGEAGGLLWYTMAYVEGESLRQRLEREVQLPIEDAVRLASEIALALDYAHRHGVVHRDIKPENILLSDGQALVADFGVARAINAGRDTRLTDTGLALGTPTYMSPEQATASSTVDGRSDIYALGTMLFEMLAGEPPFTGPTAQSVVAKRFLEATPHVRTLRETVPVPVEQALLKSLEKLPADRFATGAEFAAALHQPSLSGAAERVPPELPHGRRRSAVLSVLALLLGGAAYLVYSLALSDNHGAGGLITVAILPFRPLLQGDETGALGIGIPDAIITRLANVSQLRVRPTSAIIRYQDQAPDLGVVAKALRIDYVLNGTVEPAGERLRVSVQLLRAKDGALLWGEHYDLARQDLLTLQDSIATRVSAALSIRMSDEERARVYRHYTSNAAAYEHYLAGRAQLARLTRESTLAAVDNFEHALRLDPNYALARAGLAMASADMHLRFAPAPEVKTWGARAEQEARHALALDPNLAEAHLAMAAVYRKAEFNWDGTLEESRRALALNPSLDLGHYYRAAAFYHLGLFERARGEVREGEKANPENRVEQVRTDGVIALLSGHPGQAVALFEQVRRLSDRPVSDSYLALAYFYYGERAQAEATLDTLSRSSSASAAGRAKAALASFVAARGDRNRAQALLREVTGRSYMDHHVAYSIGATYAQLGQPAEARRWLAQAAQTGIPCAGWFAWDPLLRPLRGDSGFQQLLRELQEVGDRTEAAEEARAANREP